MTPPLPSLLVAIPQRDGGIRSWVALGFLMAAAGLRAQTVNLPVPELHTTAILTFEPVPGSPGPYLATTIDPAHTRPSPAIAVTIACNGHSERFLRTADHAIAPIPRTAAEQEQSGLPMKLTGLQPSPSRLFFTTTGPRTLLFFLSHAWASDAAALYILGFHPDGTPYRVLVRDTFDPVAAESDPDGTVRIIGSPTESQSFVGDAGDIAQKKPYALTYDPYAVYVVTGDNPAKLSPTLTEQYNRQHYVWAGPESSEKIAVVYNLPGHPRPFVTSADEAVAAVERALKTGPKKP